MSAPAVYGLWCLCHPGDGVRYVGQTVHDVLRRLSQHLVAARSGNGAPVYNWIRKHGEDHVCASVLEVCLSGELDKREAAWIRELRDTGRLLNIRDGGNSSSGHRNGPHSAESLEKMRESALKSWTEARRSRAAELRRGSGNSMTNLTDQDVQLMRGQRQAGESYACIGDRFGLSASAVSLICRRITWSHVP